MFSWLFGWLNPRKMVPSVTIRCIRVPADGSPPHMIVLNTIDIYDEGNVDSFLFHIPDVRAFWGSKTSWRYRDLAMITIENQPSTTLNGCYYGFKSFNMDELPANKHVSGGIRGDAFIAKVTAEEYDEHGWATWTDVPPELLQDRFVLSTILGRLAEM
ncbi:hypothetical protein AcW1_004018 [Taiwanofungus camphoratus]|nr:hypothetical protein AcW2_006976 [Antrodia cinnamomea]KAI0959086.1 hypothetical protein AcW1_004018 [Antrodia cinnamomea]